MPPPECQRAVVGALPHYGPTPPGGQKAFQHSPTLHSVSNASFRSLDRQSKNPLVQVFRAVPPAGLEPATRCLEGASSCCGLLPSVPPTARGSDRTPIAAAFCCGLPLPPRFHVDPSCFHAKRSRSQRAGGTPAFRPEQERQRPRTADSMSAPPEYSSPRAGRSLASLGRWRASWRACRSRRLRYRLGEFCQFDLWQPSREIPVGFGQTRVPIGLTHARLAQHPAVRGRQLGRQLR